MGETMVHVFMAIELYSEKLEEFPIIFGKPDEDNTEFGGNLYWNPHDSFYPLYDSGKWFLVREAFEEVPYYEAFGTTLIAIEDLEQFGGLASSAFGSIIKPDAKPFVVFQIWYNGSDKPKIFDDSEEIE